MIGKIIIIFFFIVLNVLACGIKGPPLPPIEEQTVQKQMAIESAPASSDSSKAVKEKKKK